MLAACLCIALWLTATLLSPRASNQTVDRDAECTTSPSCHDGEEPYGCFVGRTLVDAGGSKPADIWTYVHLARSEDPCELVSRTEAFAAVDNRDGSFPKTLSLPKGLHKVEKRCGHASEAAVWVALNHKTCRVRHVDDSCGGEDAAEEVKKTAGVSVKEIRYVGEKRWRVTVDVSGLARSVVKKSTITGELVEDTQENRERLAALPGGVWQGVVESRSACVASAQTGTAVKTREIDG